MEIIDSSVVIKPFGPVILKSKIKLSSVSMLNSIMDDPYACGAVLDDWSHHLAGQLKKQVKVTEIVKQDFELLGFLISNAKNYLLNSPNPMAGFSYPSGTNDIKFKVELDEAWVNEMEPGDYNPIHHHANCQIACVGFLRNPTDFERELSKQAQGKRSAGCLQFIDGRALHGTNEMFLVTPVVGEVWFFPAWMPHCVYPFKSLGIRRSFSANFSVRVQGE